jgi:diguanylate cyclase
MHQIIDSFLENMTLIITFMFLALKLKEFTLLKIKNITQLVWLVPFVFSLLSVFVMHHPLIYKEMLIDLRGTPIFFASYLGGWKWGFISIVLPSWYRYDLGGPTALEGITQGIIIPFLIGSLFHNRKAFIPPCTIININHMLKAFMLNEILKSALMIWTTPVTLNTAIAMIVFEFIALLSIGLMHNDTNRNFLSRRELEYQSRRDMMTNLYNLRHFKNKVDELINQKVTIAIAMFDVDHFKKYNDTHGHPNGDSVLRIIGQLLIDNLREEEVFARYGGEEFIICFFNVTNIQTVVTKAERFREKVEEYKFYGEETQPSGRITISIGLSSITEGKSLDELIEEADQALYKAKEAGRNCIAKTDYTNY